MGQSLPFFPCRYGLRNGRFTPVSDHSADIAPVNFDVRFTPESGHSPTRSGCLLWADFVAEVAITGALRLRERVETITCYRLIGSERLA
jgi:hypothetical protein